MLNKELDFIDERLISTRIKKKYESKKERLWIIALKRN